MKLLIITQKVDKNDPILGFFHRWIEEFAKHCESLVVICLEEGESRLPQNVKIVSLGKEGGHSRLKYVFRFYKYISSERKNYDVVFVHMNQEYVILGWKLWKILGKKIWFWRNHVKGNLLTRISVWVSDRVFCTSPESYTARFKKTEIMPVGIDTEFFKPDSSVVRVPGNILFLGRISPVKKVLEFVEEFKNTDYAVTIAGPILEADQEYGDKVLRALSPNIRYTGPVDQVGALRLYQSHEFYANKTPAGSFDKTILEALACGCKMMVDNPAAANIKIEDHDLTVLIKKVINGGRNYKNILFLINSMGMGGAEKIFALQESMLSRRGYNVQLKTLYGDKNNSFRFRHFFDIFGILRLRRFIKEENISLVYSTLNEANVHARLAKLFNPKIRIIIRESNDGRRKSWKFKFLDIVLNFFTYRLVAVSRGVAESLKGYQPMHKGKISVINNGIDIPSFNYDERFNGKSKKEVFIINVGNLTPQKNQLALLKIFKRVCIEIEGVKLIVVGEGIERENLEKYIRENDLEKKVILFGLADKEQMSKLLKESHILVSTSLWEGFPNVILEAGANGLPVVATDTYGTVDVIKGGKGGFLVNKEYLGDMEEKIIDLVKNDKLRYDMGLELHNIVRENYTMEKNLTKLIDIMK